MLRVRGLRVLQLVPGVDKLEFVAFASTCTNFFLSSSRACALRLIKTHRLRNVKVTPVMKQNTQMQKRRIPMASTVLLQRESTAGTMMRTRDGASRGKAQKK